MQTVNKLNNIKETVLQLEFLSPFVDKIKELEEKLSQGKLNVVFVGEFNSGKSSLINTLFGLNLPTNVLPETASIWRIKITKADTPRVSIHLTDDKTEEISSFEEVKKYDPNTIKYIDVFVNREFDEGIVIIDTPGLSSLNPQHRKVLENFIEEADVLLITVDANQGITKSLKEFIESNLKEKRKTYAVITKADTKPEQAIENLKSYIKSEFADFIEGVVATSAQEGKIEELKELLERISQQKERIVSESVERRLKNLCKDMSSIVAQQIENAELDLSDLEAKMQEIRKNIEETEELISRKQKEVEERIMELSEKATAIFISSMKEQIDWIVEALYDEDLKESIEHRFDKAIKKATQKTFEFVENEVEGILKDVEYVAGKLGEKHDIGKSFSIRIAELIVELRETIAALLSVIIAKIPKVGPLGLILKEIIRDIITSLVKPVTKQFVKNKVKQAIEAPELAADFRSELQRSLSKLISESIKNLLEDLETSKRSYELAYKELLEERNRKMEDFNNYIERLKEVKGKFVLCGG